MPAALLRRIDRPVGETIDPLWGSLQSARRLILIAGPCVVESEKLCLQVAKFLRRTCQKLGITYIFKASYDKAIRTSSASFRGPGLEAGLDVLAKVRREAGGPVLTDVHTEAPTILAAGGVDVVPIPAVLCRPTEPIPAAARARAIA